jgi:L-2-hydroxyglutarate oxidase LhgO
VVGAGILGLATAAELLERRPGASLAVLEKEPRPALHQTGRNSCILHSGVYYPPGSLKAELCLRGRDLMVRFCEREGIPHELCGKVIVAVDESELGPLAELERRGLANGVEGLRRIGPDELRELEPHCAGIAALHLPSTGILDYRLVADALWRRIEAGGGSVRFGARVERLHDRNGSVMAETAAGELQASYAIACAGVQSDRLVAASGGDSDERTSIVPFRGDYMALRPHARHLCRNLIYPVPDARFPFLGVHVSRRPDGQVWAGPNAVLALAREGYRRRDVDLRDARDALTSRAFWRLARRYWRTGAAEVLRDVVPYAFVAAARRYLPELSVRDVEPAPAGIRAQAVNPDGTLVDDFLFVRSTRALHVKNAPSPGATSSLAIAGTIVDRALSEFELD